MGKVNQWLSFSWKQIRTIKFWKELIGMTFGILIGAISIYYFLLPSHLVVGHVSGLCITINTLLGGTPATFSMMVTAFNAILLILAFIFVGEEFGLKTVYTALLFGPLIDLCDYVYPYTHFTHTVIDAPLIQAQLMAGETVLDAHGNPYLLSRAGEVLEQVRDSVMSAGLGMGDVWFDLVCFVFLLSISQAIEFRLNASTGGLDIIAMIINKYWHFDIGTSLAIGGALICSTAFFINDFRMVMIGLIGTWINGVAIDFFTASFNRRKRVCIISPDYEDIRRYITQDLLRGCSLYEVKGGYTGDKQTEIQALLTTDEFAKVLAYVKEHQIHAFITAGNCSEVYGLWFKHKKRHGHLEIANE